MKPEPVRPSGQRLKLSPLLFLDIDGVLCSNRICGGRHAAQALRARQNPGDSAFSWNELFESEALVALDLLMQRSMPHVVITSTWLILFNRAGMEEVFRLTGLGRVADAFHTQWDAPQNRFESRLAAIERWLASNHDGQPFAVLDDGESGSGLRDSKMERDGRVVLCEDGIGLHGGNLPSLEAALSSPPKRVYRSRP